MPAITTAKTNLRVLLSENGDVQTWLGHTGNAAQALASIIIGGFEESTNPDDIRPYLVIQNKPETHQRVKIGGDTWVSNGELLVIAEKAITAGNQDDPDAADAEKDTDWSNLIGYIADASVSEGSGGERIIARDITIESEAGFPEIDRGGNNTKRYPYWFGVISVAWGPEGE